MSVKDGIEFCFNEANERFKFMHDLGFCDPVQNSGGTWGSLLYRGLKITIRIQFEFDGFFTFMTVCPAGKEGYDFTIHLTDVLQKLNSDDDYDNKLRALRGDLKNCGAFLDIYAYAFRNNFAKIIDNFYLIFAGK